MTYDYKQIAEERGTEVYKLRQWLRMIWWEPPVLWDKNRIDEMDRYLKENTISLKKTTELR